VYYLQKLRCNLCSVVFTAKQPAGVDAEEKYDPTVGSMIALLKYGVDDLQLFFQGDVRFLQQFG